MICPRCGRRMRTTDSRGNSKEVIRTRQCPSCGTRFKTSEKPIEEIGKTDEVDLLIASSRIADARDLLYTYLKTNAGKLDESSDMIAVAAWMLDEANANYLRKVQLLTDELLNI